MKNGYDVSQTKRDGTIININNLQNNKLILNCTLTEFTDRQTILVPFRIEDRGSIETVITQSTESDEKNNALGPESIQMQEYLKHQMEHDQYNMHFQ